MTIILFADFGKFGGTRTYFFQLVNYLLKKRYKIVLLVKKSQIDNEVERLLQKNKIRVCFRLVSPFFLKIFPISLFFNLIEIGYWKFKLKCFGNLVLMSGVDYNEFFAGIFFFKKIIFINHSYPVGKIRLMNLVSRLVDGKNKIILTVSNFAKSRIVEFMGVSKDGVVVIGNTCDTSLRKNVSQKVITKNKTVVTFGHLEWYKNPIFWYEVAKNVVSRNEGVVFQWYGEGKFEVELKNKITTDGLSKRIIVNKFNREPQKILNKSYLYFQPSLVESFGMSVLEAMACGIPSVVSDGGALPELVNSKTGLVGSNHDIKLTADLIVKLLVSVTLHNKMSRESYRYYLSNFSYPIWENKMDQLFKSIC